MKKLFLLPLTALLLVSCSSTPKDTTQTSTTYTVKTENAPYGFARQRTGPKLGESVTTPAQTIGRIANKDLYITVEPSLPYRAAADRSPIWSTLKAMFGAGKSQVASYKTMVVNSSGAVVSSRTFNTDGIAKIIINSDGQFAPRGPAQLPANWVFCMMASNSSGRMMWNPLTGGQNPLFVSPQPKSSAGVVKYYGLEPKNGSYSGAQIFKEGIRY